ncbi:MAG: hypothetical protein LBK23_08630 [Oscillospiraceae bacterium]|nr:hypothetical protein [Oscillospiraceae bacterium]
MRKFAAAAALAALCVAAARGPSVSAGAGDAGENENRIAEFLSGDIRLEEISGVSGVVVGPDCRLTVDGDVDAGASFVSRGGEIRIGGSLYAGAVWLDSSEGELRARLGSVVAGYYTQSGGDVKVTGSIVARAGDDYDGLGLVNINCGYSGHNKSSLYAEGGVFARGGDIVVGDTLSMDEAEWVSFASTRGISVGGYGDTPAVSGAPDVRAEQGLSASDGGEVVENG